MSLVMSFMYCIMQGYKIFVLIIVEGKANIFGEDVRMKHQIQKNMYRNRFSNAEIHFVIKLSTP